MLYYDKWSKEGKWCESPIFTDYSRILNTLSGKKHGIIGLGTIGKEVAKISKDFLEPKFIIILRVELIKTQILYIWN